MTLALASVRSHVALALAPQAPGDPNVYPDFVDAVDPPALMVGWDDPWLDGETTMGSCLWFARLGVWAYGGRVVPGSGIDTLEQLVGYTLARLQADAYPWPVANVAAPRRFDHGAIQYLGALITFRVPVTFDQEA